MMKYYVYQLVNPVSDRPFYIGKGTGNRAWTHLTFQDRNGNTLKDDYIRRLHNNGIIPIVEIIKYFEDENEAYSYEESLIESIGLNNLTNMVVSAKPPSKRGWKPSNETLLKRSQSLRGITRTEKWRENLSESKKGKNNPMYGRKTPCSDQKRLSIIRTKNLPNYELYKTAIQLMNDGISADKVASKLDIGRNVCFKLKNRSHLFFKAFPELI